MLRDIRDRIPRTPQTDPNKFPPYVYRPYPKMMKDEDGKPKTKGHLMEAVYKMQHAKMKDSDIAVILENIFNDAYVEHEKQVKEATGLDCETLYITKAKTAVMVEETAQV